MYNKHSIDSNFGFKPIDIFHFRKGKDKNETSNLTLLNDENWVEEVQDSPLLQYTELYQTSKKLLKSDPVIKDKTQANPVKKVENAHKKENKKEPDQTLNLTEIADKKEVKNFMSDTNVINDAQIEEDSQDGFEIKHQLGDGEWEKVDKKKKKLKESDPSFYLVGNKPKQETKKDKKPAYKVDLVAPEDLVKSLMPKHLRAENKPNYEAFNAVNSQPETFSSKKKKTKGKPVDLEVKLGFKI